MATFRNDTGAAVTIDRFSLYVEVDAEFEIPDEDAGSLASQPLFVPVDHVAIAAAVAAAEDLPVPTPDVPDTLIEEPAPLEPADAPSEPADVASEPADVASEPADVPVPPADAAPEHVDGPAEQSDLDSFHF